MNLKHIMDLYEIIKNRLPKKYPKPKLAFFEDEYCMATTHKMISNDKEHIQAIFDPNASTISLPLKMSIVYADRTVIKSLNKVDEEYIVSVLLHELGHLYSGERYGYDSKQYNDENYCDKFAKRWLKVLKKEKLI